MSEEEEGGDVDGAATVPPRPAADGGEWYCSVMTWASWDARSRARSG